MKPSVFAPFFKIKYRPLLLIFLTFATFTTNGQEPNRIVAIVDDDIITFDQLRPNLGENPDKAEIMRAIQNEIDRTLRLKKAREFGIRPRAEMLEQALLSLAAENGLTVAELENIAQFERIKNRTIEQLTIEGLKYFITKDAPLEPDEAQIKAAYDKAFTPEDEYRLYNFILSEDEQNPQISKQKIAGFQQQIKDRPADFSTLAKTHSEALSATLGGDLGFLKINDIPEIYQPFAPILKIGEVSEMIEGDGEYHLIFLAERRKSSPEIALLKIRHIVIAPLDGAEDGDEEEAFVQNTLANLKQRIENGADFAQLARQYSQDEYRETGGETPWLQAAQLPEELVRRVAKLAPGEISAPFKTRFGWHIVEKLGAEIFDPVRASVSEVLVEKKRDALFEQWTENLKKPVYIEIREDRF